MAYSKKPLFLFSTVGLSVSAIAGFFIRQKILSNWKIAEFNALLKQIANLETEIKKNEKDLKDNEKLKNSIEEQIQNIKKNIKRFEESINKNNKKLSELEHKHTSWKRDIKFANFLEIYRKLKENTQNNLKKVELPTYYYRTILHYINNDKSVLYQIDKYKSNKNTEQEEKENLNKKIENNNTFLKQLEETISKLKKNLEHQKSKLATLKNQERERERENS